jgi:hypothetical protein
MDGELAAWISRGEKQILTFVDGSNERAPQHIRRQIAQVLAGLVGKSRRAVFVTEVDGRPVGETPMAPVLVEAGFSRGTHGYLKRL